MTVKNNNNRHNLFSFHFVFLLFCLLWMTLRAVYYFMTNANAWCLTIIIYYLPIWLSFATFALLILYFAYVLGGREGWDEKLMCCWKSARKFKKERRATQFLWRRQEYEQDYQINSNVRRKIRNNLGISNRDDDFDDPFYYEPHHDANDIEDAATSAHNSSLHTVADDVGDSASDSGKQQQHGQQRGSSSAKKSRSSNHNHHHHHHHHRREADDDTDSEIDETLIENEALPIVWRIARIFQCRRKYIHIFVYLVINVAMVAFHISKFYYSNNFVVFVFVFELHVVLFSY